MRGLRQFSLHLTKRLACHGISTLSALDAALPMRLAKNTHDASKVLRLPRKTATHLLKTSQKYWACHTKRFSTRFERQHSHIQKIFAYHVFIVLQTWVLVCYFDRHFSSIWREQLGHGESTECPATAFYPLCRSKAAVDVGWIKGCFDKGVSSFVYRRRTGLSKVTVLKVGWVKISQFLPGASPKVNSEK